MTQSHPQGREQDTSSSASAQPSPPSNPHQPCAPSTDSPTSAPLPLPRHPSLALHPHTPKGRGIFATAPIPARTLLELSPVLLFPAADVAALRPTVLWNYTYLWPGERGRPETQGRHALPLGLGSLFNHSNHRRRRNVGWTRDVVGECVRYTTLRNVEAGEELCISYGVGVWFEGVVEGEDSEEEAEGIDEKERGLLDIGLVDEDGGETGSGSVELEGGNSE